MDRKIVYPAQIPMVEDQLEAARFTQIGLGRLAGALFGEGGLGASGLTCTPAGAMNVAVSPGQIIQVAEIDATSFGVLSADGDPILTQYLLNETATLAVPGVGATHIIYGTLSVSDTDNAVLPFYNSANPSQVYAGPDNNGASTATTRASVITLGIGTSTPSGSVPLWEIVVPAATTAITSAMISAAPGAPLYPNLTEIAPRIIAPFNAALAQAFGGYPLNAVVADTGTAGLFWVSTAAENTTVPGATNAAWEKFGWNQFVKQGWGFSDFGNNSLYLGWRTDGTGLGLGVDETDEGTIALKADVMPSQSVFGQGSQTYYTPTPSSTETTTHIVNLTFTAPYDGLVLANASFNVSNNQPSQCQGLIQIEGSSYQPSSGSLVWSDTTLFPMSGSGLMRVKAGDSITVQASYNVPPSTSSFASVGQTITYQFTPAGYSS